MASQIYCNVGGEKVTVEIASTDEAQDIIDKLVAKAKNPTGPVIPKLYNLDGYLVPIGKNIPPNEAKSPYSVKYVPARPIAAVKDSANNNIKAIDKAFERLKIFSYSRAVTHKLEIIPAVKKTGKIIQQLEYKDIPMRKMLYPEAVYAELATQTFDVWKYSEDDLIHFMGFMFERLNLIEHYGFDELKLRNFLLAVRQAYNQNPFHNFKHSFCVTQMMYSIINIALSEKITMLEKLGLLVAAIGHDLDHPGLNNAYQMNALTELAIAYNDCSPLENHHCAMLFALLREEHLNFLASLVPADYKEVRKLVIGCILATDMGKHAELIARTRELDGKFNLDDPGHRSLLLYLLIKCADISNEARPNHVAEPWVDGLLSEFFAQSDREKEEGLPFAPFMDRQKVTKPSAQVGFISFVLLPLMEDVAKIVPELRVLIDQINISKKYYMGIISK